MKRKIVKRLATLLLLVATQQLAALAQEIKTEARLEKVSIPLGDQTVLHLSIHFPARESVQLPVLRDSIGSKVQVVTVKTDTSFNKEDVSRETINQHVTLTAFEPGAYTIPSFTFKTKSRDYSTKELTLQVLPVQVDTTKGFYDIKQPLAVKYSMWDWIKDNWLLILIPLLIVALAVYAYRFWKKRPVKEAPKQQDKIVAVPEHELAVQRLQALRDRKLWQQGQVKEYYSELTDIIREYLEKRFKIQALEQTSDEIFISLRRADISEDDRALLRQVLGLADLVKFAREKPQAAENERSMEQAIELVVHTQRVPLAQTKEDKNGNAGI